MFAWCSLQFRAQFVLGNEKLDHSTTSKFPGPTAAQTIAAKPKREDALAKLVKTSKIAYMFDGSSPDEIDPARGEQRLALGRLQVDADAEQIALGGAQLAHAGVA